MPIQTKMVTPYFLETLLTLMLQQSHHEEVQIVNHLRSGGQTADQR